METEDRALKPRPDVPAAEPGSEAYGRAIAEAVNGVQSRIRDAALACDRDPSSVRLMAVSKFNPLEAVLAAYRAGCRLFGENRVQEASAKFRDRASMLPGARLELIGHLQSNKARDCVDAFDAVQSVDSIKILEELAKRAEQRGKVLDVLFELHTGEESKSGFPDRLSLYEAMNHALSLPSIRPRGLMTMAPFTDDEAAIRASFAQCRAAFLEAPMAGSDAWDTLSMGMTNDLELAIAEGSTLVRVGTAIFGRRAAP